MTVLMVISVSVWSSVFTTEFNISIPLTPVTRVMWEGGAGVGQHQLVSVATNIVDCSWHIFTVSLVTLQSMLDNTE